MGKKPHQAPITDQRDAEPHTFDTLPQDIPLKPTPEPTLPDKEPTTTGSEKTPDNQNAKTKQLDPFRMNGDEQIMTTSTGVPVADDQNSLTVGERGSALLEDFILRDKIMHFDHERIPERVVHARGAAAHGYFELYEPIAQYTKADFLNNPQQQTPVFVRFSTVQGSRGSADTPRDVRGFAVRFYTQEGNFDIVGVNTPSFFIQDAIKFPDLVHALKPEPHNEIPQAQSAHDSFWDFVSLMPETMQNVLALMSDRGIPRSYSNIEGFGIHTFRMINADGESFLVRFHFKPVAGTCSLLWEESQELMGRDPDFHRRLLWQCIEAGDYPEYEFGLQIIPEADQDKFDFDLLDATKFIPEALVPVIKVGKIVLNRNPDNYFAEVEQVAYCPANLVPGIDFSEDPLLQGRIFSYVDTQLNRFGSSNFNEVPINRPVCPFHNHQQDGFMRSEIHSRPVNYEPNSIGNNWPREEPQRGFSSYAKELDGKKVRQRSQTFADYYAMPRLYWLSQTEAEQRHIINAYSFELSKVTRAYIRERVVDLLCYIDPDLAKAVAKNLGIQLTQEQLSRPLPRKIHDLDCDPSLSLYAETKQRLVGRKVAILVADGVNGANVQTLKQDLVAQRIYPTILAPHMGEVMTEEGEALHVDATFEGMPSVMMDAVIVADGEASLQTLLQDGKVKHYLLQTFKHLKPIGLLGKAQQLFDAVSLPMDNGTLFAENAEKLVADLIEVMQLHRVWERELTVASIPTI